MNERNDIWNKSYTELRIWNYVKLWSFDCSSTGFEHVTLWHRCDAVTHWAMIPLMWLGVVGSNFFVKNESINEVTCEIGHIPNCGYEINLSYDPRWYGHWGIAQILTRTLSEPFRQLVDRRSGRVSLLQGFAHLLRTDSQKILFAPPMKLFFLGGQQLPELVCDWEAAPQSWGCVSSDSLLLSAGHLGGMILQKNWTLQNQMYTDKTEADIVKIISCWWQPCVLFCRLHLHKKHSVAVAQHVEGMNLCS